jgi:PKD repeat protein
MTATSMSAHKKMHLDKKVWLVLLITCLASIALLGYAFVIKEKCVPFSINAQGIMAEGSYETSEPVFFRASLTNDSRITWDFGDGSEKQKSESVIVKHTYTKEGNFTVTAMSSNVCSSAEFKINVRKGSNSGKFIKAPQIFGSTSPKAGESVSYVSDVIGASDYEWRILDKSSFPVVNEQTAKFTFPKPGLYKLQLTVDHDRENKRTVLDINVPEETVKANNTPVFIPPVLPKPGQKAAEEKQEGVTEKPVETDKATPKATEAPVTAAKKNTQIGNKGFQKLLENTVAGEGSIESFDEYLHFKGNTTVRVYKESSPKKFSEFINEIKGKKVTIEDVKLNRDPGDETIITSIEVRIKKRGFLGL